MQQSVLPIHEILASQPVRRSSTWLAVQTKNIFEWASSEIGSKTYYTEFQRCIEKLSNRPNRDLGDWMRSFITIEYGYFYRDQFLRGTRVGQVLLDVLIELKTVAQTWYPAPPLETSAANIPPPCDFCCRDARLPGDKLSGGEMIFSCDGHAPGPRGRHNPARKRAILLARRVAARSPTPHRHWIRTWRNIVLFVQRQTRMKIYESPDAAEFRLAVDQVAEQVIKKLRSPPQWSTRDEAMIVARHVALQSLAKADRQATMGWKCEIAEIDRALERVGIDAGVRKTARLTGLHPSTVSRRVKKARQLNRSR